MDLWKRVGKRDKRKWHKRMARKIYQWMLYTYFISASPECWESISQLEPMVSESKC